ncbi:ATPase 10, plasma membrane-type-like protein [Gossypium australe]|uniref:ATPase 10, plasma membrane-type-like protein n=1 Tax=Gossypium australe TaxID=47621 RepID=A0A5B6WVN3_9ROSI|nr:ATPase 10, plasma membrane-type-like protein [Gossypium australe]
MTEMADQKDNKDIKDSPGPIPEGWILHTKFKNGIEVKKNMTYLCPATEQEFYTYEDLMRYVRYAKAAKLSIYSPEFEENMKKEGQS